MRVSPSLPILLLLPTLLLAQGRPRLPFTQDGEDPRALGEIGGEGVLLSDDEAGKAGIRPPAKGIRVTSLIRGGAGDEGGLRKGDVIVGVGRRPLTGRKSPFLELAGLLEAEGDGDDPVELRILRDGETEEVEIVVSGEKRHPRDCPEGCDRCGKILETALERLAGMQEGDGSFPTDLGGRNGKTAVTTVAGLAFLAAGNTATEGEHAEVVAKARDWLLGNAGTERSGAGNTGGKNWSQVNWALGYAPLFLGRLQAVSPADEILDRLSFMKERLLENMAPSGGWAHGPRNEFPYPLDYAELTACGNICLAALGEICSAGIEVEDEPVEKAISYIESTSDGGGGVGYSHRPGQKGMGSAGRSASALYALHRLGLARHPFEGKLADYFRRNLEDLPHGHVSPDFHYFFGALASHALGERDYRKFIETFRPEILSLWNGDGTFGVRPADTSRMGLNTDRTLGPAWRTATFALILALPSQGLGIAE